MNASKELPLTLAKRLRLHLRSITAVAGVAAVGAFISYSNDTTQLQFDAATSVGSLLALLDAEKAHRFGIWAAKSRLVPRDSRPDPPSLATTVWGRQFVNPLGIAAGFDKDAEGTEGLLGMGFGFVEIGSVTPLPQPGNPKPRCFRLPELGAVINRYGFNSRGVDYVADNLANFRKREAADPLRSRGGLVGVNLGKNKTSEDPAGDYVIGVNKLGQYADYLVINVSSPNTPGLRALQGRKELDKLVKAVKVARDSMHWGEHGPPPLLVKVAPDLSPADRVDVATVALKRGLDGLVVSNTTIARPHAVKDHPSGDEIGGLSGEPLREMATEVLKEMYRLTKGELPIIACGGVSNGVHAYEKIRAGAVLVETYTGLAYAGPAFVPKAKQELAECLARDGFKTVQEAVGADHR